MPAGSTDAERLANAVRDLNSPGSATASAAAAWLASRPAPKPTPAAPPTFTAKPLPEKKDPPITGGGDSSSGEEDDGDDEGEGDGSGLGPTPNLTVPPPPPPPPPKIKPAPIDTIIFDDDSVPKEIIADLLFESIGGQEILTISRHDTVNGQSVLYQPIKNINDLQQQYNPTSLLKVRDTSQTIFGNFTINLFERIPQVGNGPNGSNLYLDDSGNLIIELVNLGLDETVEIQITSSGTIYEAG
jgi:hypothetical protein